MSTPVFYHSGMAGFPSGNTRTNGGFVAVLDACLVNGANLMTAVTTAQAAGVATVTFAGNHNFNVGDKVLVSGATPTAFNGLQTVTAKTADSISFAIASGTASPATGTVSVKHPGAGWTKSWTDGSNAAYRSATTDGGVGAYMQIEDGNPYTDSNQSFRWRVCEGHTGLDTAARLVTDSRRFWRATDQTQWWCVADDRTAYVQFLGANAGTQGAVFSFGEVNSLSTTDDGAWVFPGASTTTSWETAATGVSSACRADVATGSWPYQLLKTWSGFDALADTTPTLLGAVPEDGQTGSLNTWQRSGSVPNPLSGAVELVPVRAVEKASGSLNPGGCLTRGVFRGVYQLTGKMTDSFFDARFTGVLPNADIGGVSKAIMVARSGVSFGAYLAFDLTGPWG